MGRRPASSRRHCRRWTRRPMRSREPAGCPWGAVEYPEKFGAIHIQSRWFGSATEARRLDARSARLESGGPQLSVDDHFRLKRAICVQLHFGDLTDPIREHEMALRTRRRPRVRSRSAPRGRAEHNGRHNDAILWHAFRKVEAAGRTLGSLAAGRNLGSSCEWPRSATKTGRGREPTIYLFKTKFGKSKRPSSLREENHQFGAGSLAGFVECVF